MITQTHLLQNLVIHSYDWLVYGGSHAWNVDHETSLIEPCHLVGQPAIPRDDNTDVIRAALNIYASEGLRETSLDAHGHA
jgi:hypothetical protein